MLKAQYDLRGAVESYREALRAYGPIPGPQHAALQYKIGYCMESIGMEDAAARLYDSVRTLLAVRPEPLLFAMTAERSGSILARQGNYARALPFFRQAAQGYSLLASREARHGLLRARNGELVCYLNLRQWTNARNTLALSEEILQGSFPFSVLDKAEVLKNKAVLESAAGRPEPALAWVRKSLGLLWPDRDISRVNRVLASPILELLALEAHLIAETSHSHADALGLIGTGLQLARRLNLPFAEDSHLPWEDAVQKLYATAVETCFQAWKKTKDRSFLEKALALAEEHKDQDWFRSALAAQTLQYHDVPDNLLKEKIRLEQALLSLEKQSWDAKQEGDAEQVRNLENRLSTVRNNLSATNTRLEREAPHFARFLQYEKRVSVNTLQKALAADQTLISYYMKGDDWFVFALSRESLQGMRIKKDIPLEIVVSNYLQRMSTAPVRTGPEREKQALLWTGTSQQLFNWVLAPVLQRTTPAARIVIIPDGPLRGVPFEALLMEAPAFATQFKSHAYLGRRYALSYAFSANLFYELSRKSPRSRFAGKYLLTVAPDFSPQSSDADTPPSSLEESKAIRKLFGGRQLKGTEATLGNFLGLAPDYRVLHLSTPARSAPFDTSFIAFPGPGSGVGPSALYAADVYGIALSADLFVLSRQESVQKTFGRTNAPDPLACGLWYAGAKSLAASSWKVDDPRLSWVVQQFFLYIRGGLPKDLALQRAKQDYLNQNANLDAHPYYWAGMTLSGNMTALPDPRLQWVVSWLIGLIGLGIALALYWKWIQKRNPRRNSGVFMDEEW
jgi:CHAT domain-containing protein